MNHYKLLWYLWFISFHDSFSDYKHRIRGSWPVPSSNPHLFDASLVTSKSVRRRRSLGGRGKDILGTQPPTHGAGCVDVFKWNLSRKVTVEIGEVVEVNLWYDSKFIQIWKSLKISSNTFDSRNIVRQSKTSSSGCMSLWHFCCSFGAGTWQQATNRPWTSMHLFSWTIWDVTGTWHPSSPMTKWDTLFCSIWISGATHGEQCHPHGQLKTAAARHCKEIGNLSGSAFNPFPTNNMDIVLLWPNWSRFICKPSLVVAASFIQLPMESVEFTPTCCGNWANTWSWKKLFGYFIFPSCVASATENLES